MNWFNPLFTQTDYDKKQFNNPQKSILTKEIFLLMFNKELIGNICLIHHNDKNIEYQKCVSKRFQGFGLSKILMDKL